MKLLIFSHRNYAILTGKKYILKTINFSGVWLSVFVMSGFWARLQNLVENLINVVKKERKDGEIMGTDTS